jgi:hypothetical protein
MNKVDIYKIFNDQFKIGNAIFIIDEDDHFIFGEIEDIHYDNGIRLRKHFYPPYLKWYSWNEIRFISHDGFPVRKLFPRSSDKYLVHLNTDDIVMSLRQLAVSVVCNSCNKLIEQSIDNYGGHILGGSEDGRYYLCEVCQDVDRYSMRGGHPFEIENVSMVVVNAGNNSYYHNYADDRFLETGILRSREGLMGLLWDFSTIFEFFKET